MTIGAPARGRARAPTCDAPAIRTQGEWVRRRTGNVPPGALPALISQRRAQTCYAGHVKRSRIRACHAMRAAPAVAVTLGALAVMSASAAAQTLQPAAPPGLEAVPGEIVVGFKGGVAGPERAAARAAADVDARQNLLVRGAQLVKVEPGQTVRAAIAELERRRDVRYAEPNWIRHATATTPDDPMFGSLWGLDNTGQAVNGHAAGTSDADIDATEAWDRNRGSPSTVVAVVDTGVAWDHPDLSPNIWSNSDEIAGNGIDDDGNGKVDDVRGWDFAYGDNNPWDYDDHGTHVAGTTAARGDNAVGIAGVAWQASLMPVQALDANGSGNDANIANAFAYAADNGAKVVNASFGGPGFAQVLSDAITGHPGTLYVVAAGNAGKNNDAAPEYPCNLTAVNLICVAATDNADRLAGFSNYGVSSVDLAAPGVDIFSARPRHTDSFNEDFETNLGNWTVQSGPWGRVSAFGSIWLADSPAGNYADGADWAIRTTSKVDLGARTDCALSLRYATILQNGADWLAIQSSVDGTAWTDVARLGDSNGGVRSTKVLLGAAGSRFYRFRLTSDAGVNRDGVFIDSVRIACPGGAYGAGDYQFLDGTSMAAPHVAGAATVLFSDTPSATVAEVRSALLDSGDALAALSGKTVTGRRLNLDAALTALVHRVATTTTITSDDPDPSVVGQPVTVQYGVANGEVGAATPTGNVTVTDGVSSCTGTVAVGECSITLTTRGSRSLAASYAGDATHHASPASASAAHEVDPADTVTLVTADDPDPSGVGEDVTVSFTVAAVPPGSGTPTGDVTVSSGHDSCTGTVAAGSCTLSVTTAGTRTLTASYAGDGSFNGSASATEPHTTRPVASDFNGDGLSDLAVGVPGENVGSVVDAGLVNVIYGSAAGLAPATGQAWTQSSPEVAGNVNGGERFGTAVASADFNGDGFDDLAVGAPGDAAGAVAAAGSVTVLLGSAGGLTGVGSKLYTQDSVGIGGTAAGGDEFGAALAAGALGGSVDDDLAIGAPGDIFATGVVHVLFGSSSGVSQSGDLDFQQSHAGGISESGDHFGAALAIGDLGQSSANELAIGAPGEDTGLATESGAVSILPSALTTAGSKTFTQSTVGVPGTDVTGDALGSAVAIGDVAGAASGDLAIGAPGEDVGGLDDAGQVLILPGSAAGVTTAGSHVRDEDTSGVPDVAEASDRFGAALVAADVVGDGKVDLAIGAPGESVAADAGAGQVTVLRGSSGNLSTTGASLHNQDRPGIADTAEPGDHFGASLASGHWGNGAKADLAFAIPEEDVTSIADAGALATLYGAATLGPTGNQYLHQATVGIPDSSEPGDAYAAGLGDG